MKAFNLTSVTGRAQLPPRREPYYVKLVRGCYLGFRKMTGDSQGTWVARFTESGTNVSKKESLGALEDRLPFERYEAAKKAVRLLRLDPNLDVIPLQVIERWRTSSGGTTDPRSALWTRLILERNWKQFLAGTAAGDEIRRGSPLVFVVPAAERDRIVRRYPLSPTRARG